MRTRSGSERAAGPVVPGTRSTGAFGAREAVGATAGAGDGGVRPPDGPADYRGGSLVFARLSPPGAGSEDPGFRVAQLEEGHWRITGYAEARGVMMSDSRQAGFKADLVLRMPSQMVPPVLYQHGDAHREQRSQSARYFSPAVTNDRHVPRMERYAEQIISAFEGDGRADLRQLASQMAVCVAADVVGLTNSPREAMARRLDKILHGDIAFSLRPRKLLNYLLLQWRVLDFYLRDVRPAIRARRSQPADDVISHLLSKGRRGPEILAECITYGAAGMVTTQEFICLVVWQCLRDPSLAEIIRGGDRDRSYRLLNELLRLDPVVRRLYRRPAHAVTFTGVAGEASLAAGDLVEIDVVAINHDPTVAGAATARIDPERDIPRGTPRSLMGFGAGPHRCAGEFIALAETYVFVRRLLRVAGLAIEREPTILHNGNVEGYELRDFLVRCDGVAR